MRSKIIANSSKYVVNKRQILIPGKAPRRMAAICLCFLGQFLLGILLSGAAFAQGTESRVTTLLPTLNECKEWDSSKRTWEAKPEILAVSDAFPGNTKKICYLEFNIESIPKEATITSAVLRIVQNGNQPSKVVLVINVASIPKDHWTTGNWVAQLPNYEDHRKGFSLGSKIRSSKSGNDAVDAWTYPAPNTPLNTLVRSEANKRYIALLLSAPPGDSQSGRNYYPKTKTGDKSNDASKQPRLILTYTVPRLSTSRRPVSQSDGWAAMRSPRNFMPSPNIPAQDSYRAMQVVDGTNISSYTAAIYRGLAYVVRKYPTQANLFEWRLDAQEPLGRIVWSKPLPSALKETARVVVNDSGRLTIVSGARFIVYQLNQPNPREEPASPLKDEMVKVSDVTPAALLPAPDGSLYVIGYTDLYALNPDFEMLWKTGIGTSANARMTLSPDGQFVYATGLLPEQGPSFLAINAQTGKAPPSMSFENAINKFHVPVVIKHPDGADYIYIAANSGDNGVLRTVKNVPNEQPGDSIAELTKIYEEPGLFSQPAPDSAVLHKNDDLSKKKLYVLWKEKNDAPVRLVSVNGRTGKIDEKTEITDSKNKNAAFANDSWLWNGGNLAMDAGDNVFFWENGTLYGYQTKPSASKLFAWKQPEGSNLPQNLELLFGAEGTLFAQHCENDECRATAGVFALIPTYSWPTAAASISSPTNLRVDGTATSGKTWTLDAPGSLFLGNGFTVKQGAELTVKNPK